MNWYKKAQSKKLLKNIEKKKQISIQKGWTPEEVEWSANMAFRLGNPQYFSWLLNQTRNGSANIQTKEDDKKIFKTIQKFQKLKDKKMLSPEQSDINQIKTFPDLFKIISQFEGEQKEISNKAISQIDGAKIIYSEGPVSIVKVDKSEAGEQLFSDGWCVKEKETFDEYGPPFYMFRLYDKPYALYHHGEDFDSVRENLDRGDFKDEHDDDMDMTKMLPIMDAAKSLIKDFLDVVGEGEIMTKAIEKEKEINFYCQNNDFKKIEKMITEDISYANLIDQYHLTPSVLSVVEKISLSEYKKYSLEDKNAYEINDFYASFPYYLDKNKFPLTENQKEIVKKGITKNAYFFKGLNKRLKRDKEIFNAGIESWKREVIALFRIADADTIWNSIPAELKTKEFIDIVVEELKKILPENLYSWKRIPKEFKTEELKKYYEISLDTESILIDPSKWVSLPEHRKKELKKPVIERFKNILLGSPEKWKWMDFSQDFKIELRDAAIEGWKRKLGSNIYFWDTVTKDLRPELKSYAYEKFKELVIKLPWSWKDVTEDLRTEELKNIAYKGWKKWLVENPNFWQKVTEDLRTEELENIAIERIKVLLRDWPPKWGTIIEELKTEETRNVAIEESKGWLKLSVDNWQYIPEDLQPYLTQFYNDLKNQTQVPQTPQVPQTAFNKSWYKKAIYELV